MSAEKMRSQPKLNRPSIDTKFRIDYDWWDRSNRDLEVFLRSHLCEEHRTQCENLENGAMADHVDPETGEVTRIPMIQYFIINHCSQQADYITSKTSLVNAIFLVFLANGNTPLSALELGDRLGRQAKTILRMLAGQRVYNGIRPYYSD